MMNAPVKGRGVEWHEVACGLFLASLATWGMERLGPTDPGPWIALALMAIVAISAWRDIATPGPNHSRLRMAAVPVALALIYFRLGVDVPRLVTTRADAGLLAWDRRWLGETPALSLVPWHSRWLTEALSGCYMAYFAAYVGYLVTWLRGDAAVAWRFLRGFCCIQAAGFAGYCAFPASGPARFMSHDLPVLPMGPLGTLNDWIVRTGCNGVDVFPSLHVATTVFWVGFDALENRWRRVAWLALPAAGLCFSTLYLRYHYAADVLAGFALGLLGLAWARRINAGRPDAAATNR